MNYKLNELKAARPNDKAIIEAFQTAMVNKADIISPNSRRALLKFPMQFVQPIRTSDGEWTTQLHIWAGLQLRDLLKMSSSTGNVYSSAIKTPHASIAAWDLQATKPSRLLFSIIPFNKNKASIKNQHRPTGIPAGRCLIS